MYTAFLPDGGCMGEWHGDSEALTAVREAWMTALRGLSVVRLYQDGDLWAVMVRGSDDATTCLTLYTSGTLHVHDCREDGTVQRVTEELKQTQLFAF